VVAFGVSDLLSGWGRQYLTRRSTRPCALQLVASGLLLLALLQSIWGYWGFRDVPWSFGKFILALAPLLALVAAVYLINPVPGESAEETADLRAHYFEVSRAIFGLLAVWVALATIVEFVLIDTSLHLGQAVRVAAVTLLVALGFTSSPALHWVGLAALASLQLVFIGVVTPVLD